MAAARLSEPGDLQAIGLNVIAFPGASNWPLWVGEQKGFFAGQGLEMSLSITPNSVHMARELYAGGAHVALTSMDNVVAYGCGEGEVSLGEPADFFAFMSVDDGLLSLMAQPEHGAVSCLRGRLSRSTRDDRIKVRLVRATAVLGPYQGVVAAACRRWASDNVAAIHGFMRGYDASLRWLCDPANADEARSLLVERLPSLRSVADGAYRVLITERGLDRTLRLRPEAVDAAIRLRERYGSRRQKPGLAEDYMENDCWRAVFC
jgi:ABC-type nitrate/sulfonate/bicarbonate transport system substrate-binding protein